jgi:acyl-CoA thioesterase-2
MDRGGHEDGGEVSDGGVVDTADTRSDVVRVLDELRSDGPGRFIADPILERDRTVVEGAQLLAQAIVAAGREHPDRRPVSAHMEFLRAADGTLPIEFGLEALSDGRTFSGLRVDVRQGERLCASGNLLLDVTAPDVIRHHVGAPTVARPSDCEVVELGLGGQEVRVADGAFSGDPDAPAGPPEIDAWVRVVDAPDDPSLHAGLLTQFCGQLSIAAALRPHPGVGQDQAHRSLSTAVNAISLSIHAPVRAERWLLYRHLSTFAGDGMTHSECRVHDGSGALVASFSVDAMVRAPASVGADPRRSF